MPRTLNHSVPASGTPPSNGLFAQLYGAGFRLLDLYRTDQARRRLAKLDDYMLEDIGIDPRTVRRSPTTTPRRG